MPVTGFFVIRNAVLCTLFLALSVLGSRQAFAGPAHEMASAYAQMTPAQRQALLLTPAQRKNLAQMIDPTASPTVIRQISDALKMTPAQQKEALCLSQHAASQCPAVELTANQKTVLHRFVPGLKITPVMIAKLQKIAMDDSLSVDQRVTKMEKLTGFHLKHPIKLNVCIWDIAGKNGPIYTAAQDQRARILKYGIDANMQVYTNEAVMINALKAGRCDAALMDGLRARSFNKFTGTSDAIGGVESLKEEKLLLRALASPQLAPKMVSGKYVVMGIAPAGGAYVFVDNKKINSLTKAAGKKVAVLAYDKVQAQMIAGIGATPVPTSIAEAPNMFNNHVVDILAAPLVAYQALELYKGMTPDGGIINLPIAEVNMQLIGRTSVIPNIAAQLVREAFFEGFDKIEKQLKKRTDRVPKHWWIDIPPKDQNKYEDMMQQARLTLRKKGYYDASMLRIMRKVRCHFHPARAECTNPVE